MLSSRYYIYLDSERHELMQGELLHNYFCIILSVAAFSGGELLIYLYLEMANLELTVV